MNNKEYLEATKFKLNEADNKVEQLKRQYKEIENDIKYWERYVEALRVVNSRNINV